jgi:hypothetical protein
MDGMGGRGPIPRGHGGTPGWPPSRACRSYRSAAPSSRSRPPLTLTETRKLLSAASASLTGLGLAVAVGIEDLIARLAPERASLRYATTPMAIELIARKRRGRPAS